MVKGYDVEKLAEMSIEQIDMIGREDSEENSEAPAQDVDAVDQADSQEADSGEQQAVDESVSADAEHHQEEASEEVSGVEMKSGKGKIPYSVLKQTRDELAEAKRQLQEMKKAPLVYQSVAPENHAEQVAAAQEEFNALAKEFEDGNLEWEEYQAKLSSVTLRQQALLAEKIKAEISAEMQAQVREQQTKALTDSWQMACNSFIDGKPDGVDYRSDQHLMSQLDSIVKALGQDSGNEGRDFDWFLSKAHAAVMGMNSDLVGKPMDKGKKSHPVAKEERPFQTLSDIPGGMKTTSTLKEQVAEMSGASLVNRFMADPNKIDEVLATM